jgi:hypothetical protein
MSPLRQGSDQVDLFTRHHVQRERVVYHRLFGQDEARFRRRLAGESGSSRFREDDNSRLNRDDDSRLFSHACCDPLRPRLFRLNHRARCDQGQHRPFKFELLVFFSGLTVGGTQGTILSTRLDGQRHNAPRPVERVEWSCERCARAWCFVSLGRVLSSWHSSTFRKTLRLL